MVFSEVIEIIVALIPEKVRKIIGSILLIFGTVVFCGDGGFSIRIQVSEELGVLLPFL